MQATRLRGRGLQRASRLQAVSTEQWTPAPMAAATRNDGTNPSRQVVAQENVDADAFLIQQHPFARERGERQAARRSHLMARILVDHCVGHATEQSLARVRRQLVTDPHDVAGAATAFERSLDAAVAGTDAVQAEQL